MQTLTSQAFFIRKETQLFQLRRVLVEDISFTQWPNFLVNLAGVTSSQRVHACWVWKWKLRYLESRKSVSCFLWSKSLLLLGLLIPHGAAVLNTHSNNPPLLFSDTRLSFMCFLSFICFSSTSCSWKDPPSFSIHILSQSRRCSQRGCQCKEKSCPWSQNFTLLTDYSPEQQEQRVCVRWKEVKQGWNYLFVYMRDSVHMYNDSFKIPPSTSIWQQEDNKSLAPC